MATPTPKKQIDTLNGSSRGGATAIVFDDSGWADGLLKKFHAIKTHRSPVDSGLVRRDGDSQFQCNHQPCERSCHGAGERLPPSQISTRLASTTRHGRIEGLRDSLGGARVSTLNLAGRSLRFVIRDALLGIIALSGYIYFCYKFGSPDLGNNDFYRYEAMVEHPFDLAATTAPFVLRQLPTIVAHVLYVSDIFYDTRTNLDVLLPGDDATKRIFFALILSNALAVWISLVISLQFIRKRTRNNDVLVCFCYIGVMLSYFYFPFSVIAPLTIGWGWLATSILAIALFEARFALLLLGCATALLARETILIFMLVFSVAAWASFARRQRFLLISAMTLAAACGVLILARIYLVHGYEVQFDPDAWIANFHSFRPSRAFLFQAVIPQALIFVLLLLVGLRHRSYAAALFAATAAIFVAGIGSGEAPGGMRAIGETLPLYIVVFLLTRLGGLPFSESKC